LTPSAFAVAIVDSDPSRRRTSETMNSIGRLDSYFRSSARSSPEVVITTSAPSDVPNSFSFRRASI
jgi:hypothetical protein